MSIEKMVEDLKTEMKSIYSHKACLSEDLFSLCPHCRKRIIDSIVEEEYLALKNKCQECQPLRQKLTGQVIVLFEGLGFSRDVLQKDFKNRSTRKGLIVTLNGIFTTGPNVPLCFPQTCLFELTYSCNLKCKHCCIGNRLTTKEMDTKSALQVIKNVAEVGFRIFELTGGEPLMRDDLLAITKEIKSYDMDVNLNTNGTLLSVEKVRELKPYIDEVIVSIDSHEESMHDNFRGVVGAQKMATKGIKNCIDNDIPVSTFTTLTKFNYNKLPELVNFMKKLEVSTATFFDLTSVGRASTVGSEFRLTINELKTAVDTLYELKKQSDVSIRVIVPYKLVTDERLLNKNTLLAGVYCMAGNNFICISPEGDIIPCTRMRITLGNALTDEIKEVWINSPVLKELRNRERLKGNCGKCEYKYICMGCRANPYAEHGDYLMEDPRCM
jgi:radical SAM protein with 4Fe4S-binding SPASM domain